MTPTKNVPLRSICKGHQSGSGSVWSYWKIGKRWLVQSGTRKGGSLNDRRVYRGTSVRRPGNEARVNNDTGFKSCLNKKSLWKPRDRALFTRKARKRNGRGLTGLPWVINFQRQQSCQTKKAKRLRDPAFRASMIRFEWLAIIHGVAIKEPGLDDEWG